MRGWSLRREEPRERSDGERKTDHGKIKVTVVGEIVRLEEGNVQDGEQRQNDPGKRRRDGGVPLPVPPEPSYNRYGAEGPERQPRGRARRGFDQGKVVEETQPCRPEEVTKIKEQHRRHGQRRNAGGDPGRASPEAVQDEKPRSQIEKGHGEEGSNLADCPCQTPAGGWRRARLPGNSGQHA